MPKIPLYQPRNVDFGGQTPKIPQNIMGPPLTVNARANTRAGEAQIRALGAGIRAREAMVRREDALTRKFLTIAEVGNTVHQSGMRWIDLSQETQAYRAKAQFAQRIAEITSDYETNPEWSPEEIEADYSQKMLTARQEIGKGLMGIYGARFQAESERAATMGLIEVRSLARKKILVEAKANDQATKEAAYRSLAAPGIGPGKRAVLAEDEKTRIGRLVTQGLLNEGEGRERVAELEKRRVLGDLDELLPTAPEAFADALSDPQTVRRDPQEEQVRQFVRKRLPWLDRKTINDYRTRAVAAWEKQIRVAERKEAAMEKATKQRQKVNYLASISDIRENPENWDADIVWGMEARGEISPTHAERLENRIEAREKGYTKAEVVQIKTAVLSGAMTEDEMDEALALSGFPPDEEEKIRTFAQKHIGRETPEVKAAIKLTNQLIAGLSPLDPAWEDQEKRMKIQMQRSRVYEMIWARADANEPVTSAHVLLFVNEVSPLSDKQVAFDNAPNPTYGHKGDLSGALRETTRLLDQAKREGAPRQRIRELQREVSKVTALIKLLNQSTSGYKAESGFTSVTGKIGGTGLDLPETSGKKKFEVVSRGY